MNDMMGTLSNSVDSKQTKVTHTSSQTTTAAHKAQHKDMNLYPSDHLDVSAACTNLLFHHNYHHVCDK